MSNKIGFWSVVALVIGSQVGTGIFMLPSSLASYGQLGLFGWFISGFGAITLGCVFSWLCSAFPETGGPHVYVKHAFGSSSAFYTGWTYWMISWVSTTAVIVTCIGYISPLLGIDGKVAYLGLELVLLLIILWLNLRGLQVAGKAEFFLTLLKFIPLFILPICAFTQFDYSNIVMSEQAAAMPAGKILAHATMLTLWGFIGLESATTPAGSVENPTYTIPRAIIFGTIGVALLYIMNSAGIMGMIPASELAESKAAYSEAAKRLWGGNWHLFISFIAGIICIGTLNAWVITSGQISLGLAEDNLLPAIFKIRNKADAPAGALIISNIGMIPLLVMTANDNLAQQVMDIIDISVTAFVFIYLICVISYLKLMINGICKFNIGKFCIGLASFSFCIWIISQTALATLLIASLFTVSGIPMMIYIRTQRS